MKLLIITITLFCTVYAKAHHHSRIETLKGAQIYRNSVKIQVDTGGCTWKHSFGIRKELKPDEQLTRITFIRIIPDFCQGYFPEGRFFTYTMSDLRLKSTERFYIGNPFYPNP